MSSILFLSSDPVLREKNLEILQQSGVDVQGASACVDGLVILDKNEFDIVVIDDELADISGYEACVKVRQQSEVYIVLLGTVAESDVWSKAEELGFDLYLRKPVSPRELLARVKALLRRPGVEKKAVGKDLPPVEPAPPPQTVEPEVAQPPVEPAPPPQTVEPEVKQPPVEPAPSPHTVEPEVKQPPVEPAPSPQTVEPEVKQPPVVPVQPYSVFTQPAAGSVQPPMQEVNPPVMNVQSEHQQSEAAQSQPEQVASSSTVQQPAAVPRRSEPPPVVVPPIEQKPIARPVEAPVVKRTDTQTQKIQPVFLPEDTTANILDDARTVKLVEALVSGKISDITPVIDFNYKLGFAYPSVDSLLDTSDQESLNVLENLASGGILIKDPYEKFFIDPENTFQLVPTERCPHCDSADIIRGQLVEHFACGFVGIDKDFKQDSRYICPKCRKDLRLIGTDYRNIGIHYRCQDCNEVFTTPLIKWRNLKTRKVWNSDELKEVEVYSYRFSPDKRGWLEFQLKPKAQLVDFLKERGYEVQELAQMTGRSGAVHTIDVMAIRDDIVSKINLGIGLLVANTGESEVGLEALFKYDTRTYDIGINYKVVIAIPKLGQEAMNFANRQMIRAFEARTLASVVSNITSLAGAAANTQAETEQTDNGDSLSNARSLLVRFLRKRGYEVYERALIAGKSGVDHIFDIFARRDDHIIVPTMAIGIGVSDGNQPIGLDEISRFDAAAFDSGIRNKVFIAIPSISVQSRQFARQQRIDIFEQQDLDKFV